MNYFAIFFEIFLLGMSMNGIRDKIIFLPFSAYLNPFWLEIKPEGGFLSFWLCFAIFFSEFSCSGRVWTEFGTKFFSLFPGLSHPFLAKNNVGKWFFHFFFKCFCYLFLNYLTRVEYERNSELKFFSHFLGLSQPILAKNNAGKRLLNFFTIFFSYPSRVGTEFGTKFYSLFLSLSEPVLDRNNVGMMFFNFFAIFVGIFSTGSGRNEIRD